MKYNPSTVMNALRLAFDASPDNWKHDVEHMVPTTGKRVKKVHAVILDGPMAGMYLSKNVNVWTYYLNIAYHAAEWQWYQPDAIDLCKHVTALEQRLEPILTSMSHYCGVTVPPPERQISEQDARTAVAHEASTEWLMQMTGVGKKKPRMPPEYAKYLDQLSSENKRKRADLPVEYWQYQQCKKWLANSNTEGVNSGLQSAYNLYILGQAAGVGADQVAAMLKEQPRRIVSAGEVIVPSARIDRVRYAKAFFRTWSHQKAMRALSPNVEGTIPLELTKKSKDFWDDAKTLLSFVPSWKQIAQKEFEKMRSDAFIYDDDEAEKTDEELLAEWVFEKTYRLKQIATMTKSSLPEMRPLVKQFTLNETRDLTDTIYTIQKAAPTLAETHEGRQLIRAMNEKDWKRVLRGHDQAMEAMEQQEAGKKSAKGIKFKQQAKKLNLPDGVTPLTTEREYATEGVEMKHCVGTAGYCHRESSLEFAFKAEDGTRATLELSTQGQVIQFRGPRNEEPSPATLALLRQFLDLNANNIQLMKEGQLSAISKANPLVSFRVPVPKPSVKDTPIPARYLLREDARERFQRAFRAIPEDIAVSYMPRSARTFSEPEHPTAAHVGYDDDTLDDPSLKAYHPGRETAYTPFNVLHRLSERVYDWLTNIEPHDPELAIARVALDHIEEVTRVAHVNYGQNLMTCCLDTAAGRGGALGPLFGPDEFADLLAKYVLPDRNGRAGRIAFNVDRPPAEFEDEVQSLQRALHLLLPIARKAFSEAARDEWSNRNEEIALDHSRNAVSWYNQKRVLRSAVMAYIQAARVSPMLNQTLSRAGVILKVAENPSDITLDLGSMGRHPLYGSRHWGERVAERVQSAPLSVRKQFYEIYLKLRRGQTKERYVNERLDIQFGGAKGKIGNYLIVAYHGGVPDMITVLLNQELISEKNAMARLVQADEIFSPPLSFTIERPKGKATTAALAPEPTKPLTRKQREAQMMMEMARRNPAVADVQLSLAEFRQIFQDIVVADVPGKEMIRASYRKRLVDEPFTLEVVDVVPDAARTPGTAKAMLRPDGTTGGSRLTIATSEAGKLPERLRMRLGL